MINRLLLNQMLRQRDAARQLRARHVLLATPASRNAAVTAMPLWEDGPNEQQPDLPSFAAAFDPEDVLRQSVAPQPTEQPTTSVPVAAPQTLADKVRQMRQALERGEALPQSVETMPVASNPLAELVRQMRRPPPQSTTPRPRVPLGQRLNEAHDFNTEVAARANASGLPDGQAASPHNAPPANTPTVTPTVPQPDIARTATTQPQVANEERPPSSAATWAARLTRHEHPTAPAQESRPLPQASITATPPSDKQFTNLPQAQAPDSAPGSSRRLIAPGRRVGVPPLANPPAINPPQSNPSDANRAQQTRAVMPSRGNLPAFAAPLPLADEPGVVRNETQPDPPAINPPQSNLSDANRAQQTRAVMPSGGDLSAFAAPLPLADEPGVVRTETQPGATAINPPQSNLSDANRAQQTHAVMPSGGDLPAFAAPLPLAGEPGVVRNETQPGAPAATWAARLNRHVNVQKAGVIEKASPSLPHSLPDSMPRSLPDVAEPAAQQFPADVLRGQRATPLRETTRRFLKPILGYDPVDVPVFRTPAAATVAAHYRAEAVTDGHSVVLSTTDSEATPRTLGLLAHELTHIAQQRVTTRFVPPAARSSAAHNSSAETDARTAEARALTSAKAQMRGVGQPQVRIEPTLPPTTVDRQPPTREAQPPNNALPAWNGLPAPWEQKPAWMYQPASAPVPTAASMPPPPAPKPASRAAAPPAAAAPAAVQLAETTRSKPAQSVIGEPNAVPEPPHAPEPDLDDLARQVYAMLKQRLATERRRIG